MRGRILPEGLLVFYDWARPLLRFLPRPTVEVQKLLCLGFPSLRVNRPMLEVLTAKLGVPVEGFQGRLSSDRYQGIYAAISRERGEHEGALSTVQGAQGEIPWARFKANDAAYYRMAPLSLLEVLLKESDLEALRAMPFYVPWRAAEPSMIERSMMLGLDAPAGALELVFRRLEAHGFAAPTSLWPWARTLEYGSRPAQAALMTTARAVVLGSRAIRDGSKKRPTPSNRPRLGFLVGGASQWESLRPLVDHTPSPFEPVLIPHDIFRHPTAFARLTREGRPFVSLDSALGRWGGVRGLTSGVFAMRRIRRALRRQRRQTSNPDQRFALDLLGADAAAYPELVLHVKQLRALIREEKLKAVVSANNVDSFLSATTFACRSEGIPHVCVHNTAMEEIELPNLADCDLYLADSLKYATFMRRAGKARSVEALGLPYYDELLRARPEDHDRRWLQPFPWVEGKTIIGVTTQTELVDFRPLLAPLLALVESRDDLALMIKLHPRESPLAYAEEGERLRRTKRGGLVHNVPLRSFLGACHSLVATSSTTLFWAIVLGVRPFSWMNRNLELIASCLDYMRPEVTTGYEDPLAVAKAVAIDVDEASNRPEWQARRARFMEESVSGSDGAACERILARLAEILPPP